MAGLTTTLSNQLVIVPVINYAGRWRTNNVTAFKREIVTDFYFHVSLNEFFDSQPRTVDSKKNDFSVTDVVRYQLLSPSGERGGPKGQHADGVSTKRPARAGT